MFAYTYVMSQIANACVSERVSVCSQNSYLCKPKDRCGDMDMAGVKILFMLVEADVYENVLVQGHSQSQSWSLVS